MSHRFNRFTVHVWTQKAFEDAKARVNFKETLEPVFNASKKLDGERGEKIRMLLFQIEDALNA